MTTSTKAMNKTNRSTNFSTMSDTNDHLFSDEQVQRFDADTIRNRFGENWRNLVSNVREVTQPDGSVIKEYIIEDPTLLEKMENSSRRVDSNPPTPLSDDENIGGQAYQQYSHQHMSNKTKFAEIKAKFEQKHAYSVMDSPSVSSSNGSTRPNSHQLSDDLYAKHRRGSHDSSHSSRINTDQESVQSSRVSAMQSTASNRYDHSQSLNSDKSKGSSLRRLNSADEADEEVQRIHRQGEELRRYKQELSPISSLNEAADHSRVQYEVVDEDGNPLAINGIQNLIQMSGVRAREVTQPDGSIIKEYVIDDPQVLSKIRSQQSLDQSPTSTNLMHQSRGSNSESAPPPPPRVPLRQPLLFRPGTGQTDQMAMNIQQIRVLEPQRRYEFMTSSGRCIQFVITSFDNSGQPISDSDVRELTNAIDSRLSFAKSAPSISKATSQTLFTHPKTWNPAVDFSQRAPPARQRVGSDTQSGVYDSQHQIVYQQGQPDLVRSASYGTLNHPSYNVQYSNQPSYTTPTNGNWPAYSQQNFQAPIDQNLIQQNLNRPSQTATRYMPQNQQEPQTIPQAVYPTMSDPKGSQYYQQSVGYPYQVQQPPGRFVHNANSYDMSQQQNIDPNGRY